MDSEDHFWELGVERLLNHVGVTRSTMMGFPCLRINGGFFASLDRRHGHLIVKLPSQRVAELIRAGVAVPFAPAGRTFREWAAIPPAPSAIWPSLLDEALRFVEEPGPQGSAR